MKNSELNPLELLERELQLRNYSPRTIQTYRSMLVSLKENLKTSLAEISVEQFKMFLHKRITEDDISTSSVNQLLSAFKLLQTEIFSREWKELKIKRPRKNIKLPAVLSLDEIKCLIEATKNLKHRAIITLAYSSGLRRMEVKSLKVSAIDSTRMRLLVKQGKGRKDRYTLLSRKALDILRYYYKIERPTHYLFEPQGRPGQPMSDTTLNNIVKKSAQKARIKREISFHTLRHSFATHLLEQGINIRLIQSFLGHSSIKTTSVYLHLANVDVSSITSPLDGLQF